MRSGGPRRRAALLPVVAVLLLAWLVQLSLQRRRELRRAIQILEQQNRRLAAEIRSSKAIAAAAWDAWDDAVRRPER